MIELAAPAVIAARASVLAAIGDVELATTVPAPQQTGQQRFTAPDRASAHKALAIGIVTDQTLVSLKLCPANIAVVVIPDQTSHALRSLRKPRTIRLRPALMVVRLSVRPKA